MSFEVLCVTERLAAVATLQRVPLAPFSGVYLLVPFQVLHSAKPLTTGAALIWPLARVDALMPLQVAQAAEAAAALQAPVGALSRVY